MYACMGRAFSGSAAPASPARRSSTRGCMNGFRRVDGVSRASIHRQVVFFYLLTRTGSLHERSYVSAVKHEKKRPLPPVDAKARPHDGNHDDGHKRHGQEVEELDSLGIDGLNEGGETQNRENVEDVRADHVAHGNVALSLDCGYDRR